MIPSDYVMTQADVDAFFLKRGCSGSVYDGNPATVWGKEALIAAVANGLIRVEKNVKF